MADGNGDRVVRRRHCIGALLVLGLALPSYPAEGASYRNLFEWMATAPVVVGARYAQEIGKYTEVRVVHPVRGDFEVGDLLKVDLRSANREREDFQKRLRLDPGKIYLLLLEADRKGRKSSESAYSLVRGVNGAKEIPKEGAPAFLDAVARFAEIQASGSDSLTWQAFERMLEELNPLLIQTSLEQFLKFRRETPELVRRLRPLLDHPRPDLRAGTLQLVGRVIERFPAETIPDFEGLESEVVSHARGDPSVEVRVAATEALRGLSGPSIEELLHEISGGDPDQAVRYAAERQIYERRLDREESVARESD